MFRFIVHHLFLGLFITIPLFIGAYSVNLMAETPPTGEKEKKKAKIEYEINSGRLDEAKNLLEELMTSRTLDPDLFFYRGKIHFLEKHFLNAVKDFDKSIERGIKESKKGMAYYYIAQSYFQNRDFDLAIGSFNKALGYDKELKIDYYSGLSHLYVGEWDKSREHFLKVIEKGYSQHGENYYLQALHGIGKIALFLGKYDEAINTFQKILSIDKMIPQVHYALGIAKDFKLYLKERNKHLYGNSNIISDRYLSFSWSPQTKRNNIDNVKIQKNHRQSYLRALENFSKTGDTKSVTRRIEGVLKKEPRFFRGYYALGVVYFLAAHLKEHEDKRDSYLEKSYRFLDKAFLKSGHNNQRVFHTREVVSSVLKELNNNDTSKVRSTPPLLTLDSSLDMAKAFHLVESNGLREEHKELDISTIKKAMSKNNPTNEKMSRIKSGVLLPSETIKLAESIGRTDLPEYFKAVLSEVLKNSHSNMSKTIMFVNKLDEAERSIGSDLLSQLPEKDLMNLYHTRVQVYNEVLKNSRSNMSKTIMLVNKLDEIERSIGRDLLSQLPEKDLMNLYYARAQVYVEEGHHPKAKENLDLWFQLRRRTGEDSKIDTLSSYFKVIELSLFLGEIQDATRYLKRVNKGIKQLPNKPGVFDLNHKLNYYNAIVHLHSGEFQKAIDLLNNLLDSTKYDKDKIRYPLGLSYFLDLRYDEAKRYLSLLKTKQMSDFDQKQREYILKIIEKNLSGKSAESFQRELSKFASENKSKSLFGLAHLQLSESTNQCRFHF